MTTDKPELVALRIEVECHECGTPFGLVVGLGVPQVRPVIAARGTPVEGKCPKCGELVQLEVGVSADGVRLDEERH